MAATSRVAVDCRSSGGVEPRRFCSDRCQVRAWDAKHPRLVGGRKRPRRLRRVVDREALPASYLKAVPNTLAIGDALDSLDNVAMSPGIVGRVSDVRAASRPLCRPSGLARLR